MCGQLGYSGPEPFNLQNIKTLFYINALERGEDATGLYSPLNGLKKDNIKGWEFVTDNKIDIIPDTIFMGHVRSATVGGNKADNAHPFERGNCILQHNGTLKNHWAILRKYKLDFSKYWVDSDVLAGAIDASDSAEPLKEIEGAAAVIFHDKRQPTKLFVFRNAERPLYKGHIGPNMYISSIEETLEIIGCVNIKEFKENILYTIEKGLILSQKKVKNNPYKEVPAPSTNTNSSVKTENTPKEYELKRLIGCNVRAQYEVKIKNTSNNTLKLIQDKYYRIVDYVGLQCVRIYDDITDDCYTVGRTLLKLSEDLLEIGNLAEALVDLKDSYDNILVAKGKHCTIANNFSDGTVSLKGFMSTYFVYKNKLRKLTASEIEAFNAEKTNDIITFNPLDLSGLNQTDIPFEETAKLLVHGPKSCNVQFKKPLSLSMNIDDSIKEIIISDSFAKPHIKMPISELESELTNFFVDMDSKINTIKEDLINWDNDNAMRLINEIDSASWKLYNNIYEIENANRTTTDK